VSIARRAAEPCFIDGPAGRIFALYHAPLIGNGEKGTLIYLPPFAEEMNCARRPAWLQARAFAALGFGVLQLDYFATGDSDGDFSEARWPIWLGDVGAAIDWLERRGLGPIGLWGLRFGALLAAAAANARPETIKRLVFWQPIVDGKSMLTQFLRIRIAAAMADGGAVEKVETLRAALAAGESVEVAGYELAAELADAIAAARLDAVAPAAAAIDWFEVAPEAGAALLPASQRVIDAWRQKGLAISTSVVAGDPFWAVPETAAAPLIAATEALFRSL